MLYSRSADCSKSIACRADWAVRNYSAMKTYYLEPELLERPIRVLVVGCGGNGSAVVSGLPYLHQALIAFGYPAGLEVTLVDPDTVSESNCFRQAFCRSEIGLSKDRAGAAYESLLGTRLAGYSDPDRATGKRQPLISSSAALTRAKPAAAIDIWTRHSRVLCYLDLGNGAATGQYLLGQPNNRLNGKKRDRIPVVGELYPDILLGDRKEDEQPSCSAVEALTMQEPSVNQVLAIHALALLTQFLRHGSISYQGGFCNLRTGQVTPLPIQPVPQKRRRKPAGLPYPKLANRLVEVLPPPLNRAHRRAHWNFRRGRKESLDFFVTDVFLLLHTYKSFSTGDFRNIRHSLARPKLSLCGYFEYQKQRGFMGSQGFHTVIVAGRESVFQQGIAAVLNSLPQYTVINCNDVVQLAEAITDYTGAIIICSSRFNANPRDLCNNASEHGNRVVITAESPVMTDALAEIGIAGIIFPTALVPELVQCILAVEAGGTWFPTTPRTDSVSSTVYNRLRPRDRAIIAMIYANLPNKVIAEHLSTTEQVIKNYATHIYDKFGVSSRVELVLWISHHPAFAAALGNEKIPQTSVKGSGTAKPLQSCEWQIHSEEPESAAQQV